MNTRPHPIAGGNVGRHLWQLLLVVPVATLAAGAFALYSSVGCDIVEATDIFTHLITTTMVCPFLFVVCGAMVSAPHNRRDIARSLVVLWGIGSAAWQAWTPRPEEYVGNPLWWPHAVSAAGIVGAVCGLGVAGAIAYACDRRFQKRLKSSCVR